MRWVWVACGSGDADASMVDEFDRLRVPPDDPRYTLRRVLAFSRGRVAVLRRLCERGFVAVVATLRIRGRFFARRTGSATSG